MGNDVIKARAIKGRIYENVARDLAGERWDHDKWEQISDDGGISVSVENWATVVAANDAWEQVELLSDLGTVPEKVVIDTTAREGHVICAKALRDCNPPLYDLMCEEMYAVVVHGKNFSLSIQERTMLVQAFKESVNAKRRSFEQLSANLLHCLGDEYLARGVIQLRVNEIQRSVESQCWRFIKLLDSHLLPRSSIEEEKCFYLKLKGDFYRYLLELERSSTMIEVALDSYSRAHIIAQDYLISVDVTRLGLALNYAIFLDQYCDKTEEAVSLARKAYEDAIDSSMRMNETDNELHKLLNLLKNYLDNGIGFGKTQQLQSHSSYVAAGSALKEQNNELMRMTSYNLRENLYK
eukprot:g2891.t1